MDYDVAIIGGGPAGSTAATLLAQQGRKAVVIEKERFPRFHIGESLLPHSMKIFQRLGIEDQLKNAAFVDKFGGEIASACGDRQAKFYFKDGFRSESDRAYQVERSEFDYLMLKHASDSGAEVLQDTTVEQIDFLSSSVKLRIRKDPLLEPETISAKYVIDCSGQNSLIAKKLQLKEHYGGLRKIAIYAHFQGVTRDDGIDGTLTRMVRAKDRWFWMIPLGGDIMSIGMVMDTETFKSCKLSPEKLFEQGLSEQPVIAGRIENATRVNEVVSCTDYSYRVKEMTGDRWMLAGDAAGFIDPIFSSGVFLAILSGELTADILHEVIDHPQKRDRLFARYEQKMRKTMNLYLKFVNAWYRQEFIELFLNPVNTLQLAPAINALLAGNTGQSFALQWRLAVFRSLVFLQRFMPLCPRLTLSPQKSSDLVRPGKAGAMS